MAQWPRSEGPDDGAHDDPDDAPEAESSRPPAAEQVFEGVPSLLRAPTAREVLARLVDGDPLELEQRCRARQRERALLIDPYQLQLRTAARIAHAARGYAGRPPLPSWIDERLEEALGDLVEEDRLADENGELPTEPWQPRIQYLSDALGLDPVLARRACIAFNQLPHDVRRTAWEVLIEGKSLNRCVAEGHGPPATVQQRIREALQAMQDATASGDDGYPGGSP